MTFDFMQLSVKICFVRSVVQGLIFAPHDPLSSVTYQQISNCGVICAENCGLIWFGLVWYDLGRYGVVRCCLILFGMEWFDFVCYGKGKDW